VDKDWLGHRSAKCRLAWPSPLAIPHAVSGASIRAHPTTTLWSVDGQPNERAVGASTQHCELDYRQNVKNLPFRKVHPPRKIKGFHIPSHSLLSPLHHVLFSSVHVLATWNPKFLVAQNWLSRLDSGKRSTKIFGLSKTAEQVKRMSIPLLRASQINSCMVLKIWLQFSSYSAVLP